MTPDDLKQIIRQGEGISIEFKKAKDKLPENLFESVCGFLNRQGGYLVLGVQDNGTLIGVNDGSIENLKRDFTSLSNNPNKLSPPFLLELTEVVVDGYPLLYVYVPQSSQAHKCDGVMYDRKHEGDFRVVDNVSISNIYARKSGLYSENQIYPFLGLSEFKPGILGRVRELLRSRSSGHPWLALSDLELIRSAGLYQKDYKTGEEGCTLAAALLLGRDDVIQSILPHFRIDALVRREDIDRYDDRIDIRTNLIEAYEVLMLFVSKHLPDKFHLQADLRISLRDTIFREIIANFIIHREYTNATPSRFIIYQDRVETDNANKPTGFGPINPEKFASFPKNPTIAKFFVQLGRAEELGSGIRNVSRLVKYYTPNETPLFIEEDVFKATVPVPSTQALPTIPPSTQTKTLSTNQKERLTKEVSNIAAPENVQKRLHQEVLLFAEGRAYSATELSKLVSVNPRTVRRDIALLVTAGIIEQTDTYGFYEIIPVFRQPQ